MSQISGESLTETVNNSMKRDSSYAKCGHSYKRHMPQLYLLIDEYSTTTQHIEAFHLELI